MKDMPNPFQQLSDDIAEIKDLLNDPLQQRDYKINIINTGELCKRLDITPATLGRWRKYGRIPYIQIGGVVRFDYYKVIEALENGYSKKRK